MAKTPEQIERERAGFRKRTAARRLEMKRLLVKHGYTSSEPLFTDLFVRGRITKKMFALIMTLERY